MTGDFTLKNGSDYYGLIIDGGSELGGQLKVDHKGGGSSTQIENVSYAVAYLAVKATKDGINYFSAANITISGNLAITYKKTVSFDYVRLGSSVNMGGGLKIETGNGSDRIDLVDVLVAAITQIVTGREFDLVEIATSEFNGYFVGDGGKGTDSIDYLTRGSVFNGGAIFNFENVA